MSEASINILIAKYTAGSISREEFLYFHALLSNEGIDNQSLDADALVNAARQRPIETIAPPPVAHTPPPAKTRQTQAETYSSSTIDIDTNFDSTATSGYEGSQSAPTMQQKSSVIQSLSQFFSQHYKQTAAFVGIIGLMSTLVSNYFSSPSDEIPTTSIVRDISDANKDVSRSDSESGSKIESLAWRMIDRKLWGRGDIYDFRDAWVELSAKEQKKAKKSAWYRQFSLVLTTNLAQQSSLANDGNISAVYVERALSDLTDTMKSGNSTAKRTKLATTQTSQRRSDDASRDARKEARGREQRREERAARKIAASRVKTIKQADANKLIRKYIKYYESGNIKSIAKLFTDSKRRSNKRYSNSTLNEYKAVFKNTKLRTVGIDDLEWEINGDIAEGEGRYSSSLKLSNNNRKEVIADIQFRLSIRGNAVLFDSVKLINLEAKSIPAKITTASRRNTQQQSRDNDPIISKPFVEKNKKNRRMIVGSKEFQDIYSDRAKPKNGKRKPTKSELNDLVARYVDSYQYGDAVELVTLFSGATWTNDRSGIKQMRQDYQDIFDSTSARKMSIKNLRWKFKKDKALGTGNLTLSSVYPGIDGDADERSKKSGKIRLVVELRDDEALISHLYQIFN